MKIHSAAVSHVGRRTNNEDAFCAEPSLGLYVVADGMGGYEGGEIASRVVVDTLRGFVRRNTRDDNVTWPYAADPRLSPCENLVRVAIKLANDEVASRKIGQLASMGSTLAMVLVHDERAVIANVGDSRVYRLRDGTLSQCSRDHSLYAEMVAMNFAVGAREDFPHANVITRAMGMKGSAEPDVSIIDVRRGDTFLICSDGVSEPVDDASIAMFLAATSVDEAAHNLVDEAFRRGGRDNITAVVLRAA